MSDFSGDNAPIDNHMHPCGQNRSNSCPQRISYIWHDDEVSGIYIEVECDRYRRASAMQGDECVAQTPPIEELPEKVLFGGIEVEVHSAQFRRGDPRQEQWDAGP